MEKERTFWQKVAKVVWDVLIPLYLVIVIPFQNYEVFGTRWIGIPILVVCVISVCDAWKKFMNGEFWTERVE